MKYAYEFWDGKSGIEKIFDTQEEAVSFAKDDLSYKTESERSKIDYAYVVALDVPSDIEEDDLCDISSLEDDFGKGDVWDYRAELIAEKIRNQETWDDDLNRQLCDLAGMGEEYGQADGDTFESVVFKAAECLGVEIV